MTHSTRHSSVRPSRRTLILSLLAAISLLTSVCAFCEESRARALSETQIQERLNGAGYAPLWQIQRRVADYLVEGIDPHGNPVILRVDPFTASIQALESLALLK